MTPCATLAVTHLILRAWIARPSPLFAMPARRLLLCLLLVTPALSCVAAPAWVTDRFEITLRSGPSTGNEIRRMMPSGTELEVLEQDAASGYSRVRTRGGTEGWVLTRYLIPEAGAREQLGQLAMTVAPSSAGETSIGAQRRVVLAAYEDARERISALEQDKADLQQRFTDLQRVAADTVNIDARNGELAQQVTALEGRLDALRAQNVALKEGTMRQWFLAGAGVLLIGVLMGLWLPRMRRRRDHGYGRFS
ncbi:MAG: TIGR04211 family SH3 domain-containing protein [Pseudomonadota bacterium]